MYVSVGKKKESNYAPWLELVKLEPTAKTGCGSCSVPLSPFVLKSGFKKKTKNAWPASQDTL